MYFFAARQPILDRERKLYAYELLFRDSLVNAFPQQIDGDEATSKMVEASRVTMGLSEFTGNKPAFINFTLETMTAGYPQMMSPEEVVVEVLETVKPGKRLLALCKQLHDKGYVLALDDYEHQNVWLHFFPFVKIIKIDFQSTSVEQIKVIQHAASKYPEIKLLAEKVETYEQYNTAMDLGFEYFQGYFFSKPEMVKTKSLSPSQMSMAELLYETSKPELDLEKITKICERDVSLSYKLLRYANSAIFQRRSEISTIKHALILIGLKELKRFLSLIFASNVNPEKPVELIRLSMTRAKFCESMANADQTPQDAASAFLTGLMSLINAILDESFESVFEKLPLADEIKNALVEHDGRVAQYIKLSELIEAGNWQDENNLTKALGYTEQQVAEFYSEASAWASEQAAVTCDE